MMRKWWILLLCAALLFCSACAPTAEPSEEAPKIVASGRGYLAEKIIERAVEENVPLHKDDKLAGTLSKLEIGDAIPPELYEVVAEVLLFVDKVDKIKGKVKKTL